jgi:FAD:protein FMN transferase
MNRKRGGYFAGAAIVLFLFGFSLARAAQARVETVRHTQVLLGTVVDIQVRDRDRGKAEEAIAEAFAAIRQTDLIFSTTNASSEVWALNTSTRETAVTRPELYAIIKQSDELWRLSGGAFDAGLNNLIELWGFGTDSERVPSPAAVQAAQETSGWQFVRLEEGKLLRPVGVQFNFGGIVKGYAVDRAIEALQAHGIASAMVNAGGEIRSFGDGWVVGIQHPRRPGEMIDRIRPGALAVATSGDYEQYFEVDGQRYHHLLDPRTGYPAQSVQSVTVIAPTCADADGLSTAVFVLGPETGIALIETLLDTEAYLIAADGKIYMTSGFADFLVDQ